MYKTFIPDKQRIVLCSRSTTAYGPHLRSWGGRPLLDFSSLYIDNPQMPVFPFFHRCTLQNSEMPLFPFFLLCTKHKSEMPFSPFFFSLYSKTQKCHFSLFILLCTKHNSAMPLFPFFFSVVYTSTFLPVQGVCHFSLFSCL